MKLSISALGLLASAGSAIAHSTFQEFWSNGVDEVSTCARLPLNNNPVTSVSTNDIRCNAGTTPVAKLCPVTAGQNITVEMHAQPGDRSCSNLALGGNHYGPVLIYLGKVDDATSGMPTSWFKIDEEGYSPVTKKWGTDTLNDNCGKRSVKVPATLAPGNYLVRAEAIALHAASSAGGAQFYMTCFQVAVTSTGTVNPPGVAFPGAYKATDPGILINIYQASNIANYQIPGPAVWTG